VQNTLASHPSTASKEKKLDTSTLYFLLPTDLAAVKSYHTDLKGKTFELLNTFCGNQVVGRLTYLYAMFFPHGATAPSAPGPPHYPDFTITLRHTTLGKTHLDE
jgi:hypothetical protein